MKTIAMSARPRSRRLACVAALATATAAPALAVGPLVVSTRMLIEKRVAAADGTTRIELIAPKSVVPGDRVTVVLAYRNTGTRPIADLVLANPVPHGMVFRGVDAGQPVAELSVDGQRFASLAALKVASATGPARAATAADVAQVRWRLAAPVAPGAGGELRFQATLK